MKETAPRPERENQPYQQLFNVDAMSDAQILILFAGIHGGHETYGDPSDVADPLFYQLALSVRDLASRDPGRVKFLLHRCEQGGDEIEHQVAGYTAQALINYDYGFTRNALISVYVGDAQHRSSSEVARNASRSAIEILMRDHLTAERQADFNARIEEYEPHEWAQLKPAAADEPDYS
jgi:hypothetical protein